MNSSRAMEKIPIYVLNELDEVLDELKKGGVPINKITTDRHKSTKNKWGKIHLNLPKMIGQETIKAFGHFCLFIGWYSFGATYNGSEPLISS